MVTFSSSIKLMDIKVLSSDYSPIETAYLIRGRHVNAAQSDAFLFSFLFCSVFYTLKSQFTWRFMRKLPEILHLLEWINRLLRQHQTTDQLWNYEKATHSEMSARVRMTIEIKNMKRTLNRVLWEPAVLLIIMIYRYSS